MTLAGSYTVEGDRGFRFDRDTAIVLAADGESVLLSVAVTALVSGLTIGGKALGKTVALNKSTSVVYWVGRFLHLFHR